MIKIAAIIAGVLMLAGGALAGTVTSLGTSDSPTLSSSLPAATTTGGQDDRGRENETRGRANEPGEDLRGPCDEAEHANDPRCVPSATTPTGTTRDADDDHRGHNGGPGGVDHGDRSGHRDGGESGHGGHGGDD